MIDSTATVVVLTALEVEHKAVRDLLETLRTRRHPSGTIFTIGSLPGCPGNVVLAGIGAGNQTAAVITERAITEFRPQAVFFVGIAGALHDDLQLGDIVVGTKVYGYHGGTADSDLFRARPQAWDADHHLDQLAREVYRTSGWAPYMTAGSDRTEVVFRPIAAGDVVLNSRDTALRSQLRDNYNDAAAIEMEAAGASKAAQLSQSRFLAVRGISDKADGNKHSADRAGSQRMAAANAAAFAVGVIREFLGCGTAERVVETPMGGSGRAPASLWTELADAPPVVWRTDRTNRLGMSEHAALEVHLVPVAGGGRLEMRKLDLLSKELSALARSQSLFSPTEELRPEVNDRLTSVEVTDYRTGPAGIAVFRSGQRSAWSPLPRGMLGGVLDPNAVRGQLVGLLELLTGIELPAPESVALAVGVEPATLVTEDQVAGMPRNHASVLTMAQRVRVPADDAVPYQALVDNTADIADELGARPLTAFRQAR